MEYYKNILSKTSEYRLKLMSDVELQRNASVIYNKNFDLNSEQYALDSGLFGMTKSSPCQICGQTKECCLHFGLINLPYPIITNTIVIDKFIKLLKIICPCCGNFPINNAKNSLKLAPEERFAWVQQEVKKQNKNEINICPYCKNKFIFIDIEGTYPCLKYIINQITANKKVQLNPIYIHNLINNFSDTSCEYIGYNPQTFNPRNFMTKFVVIIPNKLRIKTEQSASSAITSIYANIITQIIPELNKYLKSTIGNTKIIYPNVETDNFNKMYDELNSRYLLAIDMTKESTVNLAMTTIGKTDKKHLDVSSSLMGKLKHKDHTYMEKGIISTRHNCSARTVLGEGTNLHCYQIGFPQKFCNKMGSYIPVYEENLTLVQQFIASMSKLSKHDSSSIKVNRILKGNTGESNSVSTDKALLLASQVRPGDKLFVSLLPGTLVMHVRFPCLREESWASHFLIPTQHTIQTIPLAACAYKNADFDGDETGVYANYANYTNIESLLLHSPFRQFISYDKGQPGILFDTGDIKYNINLLKTGQKLGVREIYDPVSGEVLRRENYYPPRDFNDIFNDNLDYITGWSKDSKFTKIDKINYQDAKTLVKENKLDKTLCELNNKQFYRYLSLTIGPERTMELIDFIYQNAYNLSFYRPLTLGNEIKFYNQDIKKKIEKIHEETYIKMCKIEQSDLSPMDKDIQQYLTAESQNQEIIPLLKENAKGTNIEALGLVAKFSTPYYAMVVNAAPVIIDGARVKNTIANNTRTISCFPKFSIDPCAYGYLPHGYMDYRVKPSETFYDCMLQRKGIYIRGNGTAIQGYLAKRFVMAFGPSVVDHNGGVCYDTTFISPCYGAAGVNPRYSFIVPLEDVDLSTDEFNQKYANDTELQKLHVEILEARKYYSYATEFMRRNVIENVFNTGFDYEQYLLNKPKGKTDEKLIDEFVTQIKNVFAPPGMKQRFSEYNLIYFIYYIRIKLTKIKLNRDELIELYYKFVNSLVEAGETVGLKSALGVSNCLSQESLDAIHHATNGSVDTNKLKISRGSDRFDELLGGTIPKYSVLTLGFYDPSEEHAREFAKKNETIYFKDIWSKLETCMSGDIIPDVKRIHPNIDFSKTQVNKTFIKIMLNLSILADYDVKLSELFNILIEKFPKIEFITGEIMNSKEFKAYIYFYPDVQKIDIDNYIQTWKSDSSTNVIHGKYLVNCYVTQNKNNGEWIVQANEVNLKACAFENIISCPELDPSKCHTTNTRTNLDMVGIFESSARLCEQSIYCSSELSSLTEVLFRHYKTICLGCTASGRYFTAVANSAEKIDCDYLRKINFETPATFIRQALVNGGWKNTGDVISGQFWADLPRSGSGYSKYMVIKN